MTAVGAEPGEVVQAGQMIVQVARQDGRDAVFDVPAQVIGHGARRPRDRGRPDRGPGGARRSGRVREVAPQADPVTGTFEVKVGLADPPAEMRLGATVTGRMEVGAGRGIEVPGLGADAGRTASRRSGWSIPRPRRWRCATIEVLRYDPARVVVAQGLEPGEIVVTAGVQALRPGPEGAPARARAS